jgi:hypothetical protein
MTARLELLAVFRLSQPCPKPSSIQAGQNRDKGWDRTAETQCWRGLAAGQVLGQTQDCPRSCPNPSLGMGQRDKRDSGPRDRVKNEGRLLTLDKLPSKENG